VRSEKEEVRRKKGEVRSEKEEGRRKKGEIVTVVFSARYPTSIL
jgi:hypothetical protein